MLAVRDGSKVFQVEGTACTQKWMRETAWCVRGRAGGGGEWEGGEVRSDTERDCTGQLGSEET